MRSLFVLLLLPVISYSQTDNSIKTVKVTDNIHMLQGRGGNMAISHGEDGVVLIDSKYADMIPSAKEAIQAVTGQEVRFLINTHYHGDHTGGNEILGNEGKVIVAHQNVRKRLSHEQTSEFRDNTAPAYPKAARPIITFDHFVTFHLNNDVLQVLHFAEGAHTDGDAVVYFENDDVIHMGDLFVTYGYPYIDSEAGGSLTGFIKTLDKILILINDNTKVIPGHGNISTKADVRAFRNRLAAIEQKLMKEIDAGKDMEAVIAAEPLAEYDEEWGQGFIKAKDFIMLVYPDLKSK